MEDQIKLRNAIREKSQVTIRKQKKQELLQKKRDFYTDMVEFEINKKETDFENIILDENQYQNIIDFLIEELSKALDCFDKDKIYKNLIILKNHSLLIDKDCNMMKRLVNDIVKNELQLFNSLQRLLYMQDERNYLVLYFMILYQQQDQKFLQQNYLRKEDIHDLLINIFNLFGNHEMNNNNIMFYGSILLKVMYMNHPKITHNQCKEIQIIEQIYVRIAHSQSYQELKQFLKLIACHIQNDDEFSITLQQIIFDFLTTFSIKLLKFDGANQFDTLYDVYTCIAVICQIPKQHSDLIEEINQIISENQYVDLLRYQLELGINNQNSNKGKEIINQVNFVFKNLLDLKCKSFNKDLSVTFMQKIETFMPLFLEDNNNDYYQRTLEMIKKYLQDDNDIALKLKMIGKEMIMQALSYNDDKIDKTVLEIVHRVGQSKEAHKILQTIDMEVFDMLLDRIRMDTNIECLLIILEIIQSLLSEDEWLDNYRKGQTLSYRKQITRNKRKIFDLLQDHENDDVYQTTIQIMKEYFNCTEKGI